MTQNNADLFRQCTALTGSIASGKSTVASMLVELGAHLIDTDLIAREIVKPGTPALVKIVEAFGPEVLFTDGNLNRETVRGLIINDPQKKSILNSITHPYINRIVFDEMQHFRGLNDCKPIIIDVPLLFEVGWHTWFQKVILVYVPYEIQIKRLMARDSLDELTAQKTIAAQMDIEKKKEMSSYIINNSGNIAETKEQVNVTYNEIVGLLNL
jgi:dephospho-CoA kinase